MSHSFDIDRIVQEVVQRLLNDAAPSGRAVPPPPSATLSIAEMVVTLRQVEGRLGEIFEVAVPERAVVTPSVLDLLRQHQVRLRRCSQLKPHADNGRTRPVAIGAEPERVHATWVVADGELTSAMEAAAALSPPEFQLRGELQPSMSLLATGLFDGGNAVVVSERAMLATAMANRHASLRAAWIRGTEDLLLARDQMGANVLVVDRRLPPLFRKSISFALRSPANLPPAALCDAASKENRS